MNERLWRRYRRGDNFFELTRDDNGRQFIQSFGAFDHDIPSEMRDAVDANDEEKLTATLIAMKSWAEQNSYEPF